MRPSLRPRRRSPRWGVRPLSLALLKPLSLALLRPLPLVLLAPCAHAATYLPGAEADPPTGEILGAGASPAEPLRGSGIRWVLGPWRYGGALGVTTNA